VDTIFGAGSSKELFSWRNGLVLHKVVETALDKGVIAIVPLLRPDPRFEKIKRLRKDIETRGLDDRRKLKKECIKLRDEINQEDNEKLLEEKNPFLTSARPRARYFWWTFFRAMTCLNWRSPKRMDMPIAKEAQKGVSFCTRGRYVKENQLRGFVEELGQDIESILENRLEDENNDSHPDPDPEALGVTYRCGELPPRRDSQEI
jgi:hypothetical protein